MTNTTTVIIEVDLPELARAVRMALTLREAGIIIGELPSLLASWDTIVGGDPMNKETLDTALERVRIQVDAVLDGSAVLTFKES